MQLWKWTQIQEVLHVKRIKGEAVACREWPLRYTDAGEGPVKAHAAAAGFAGRADQNAHRPIGDKTMNWKVIVLSSPEEKAAGVRAFPSPLDPAALLFFPRVLYPGAISMSGVNEPLRIYFLGQTLGLMRMFNLNPGESVLIDPGVAHVVETSVYAPKETDFYSFLAKYL